MKKELIAFFAFVILASLTAGYARGGETTTTYTRLTELQKSGNPSQVYDGAKKSPSSATSSGPYDERTFGKNKVNRRPIPDVKNQPKPKAEPAAPARGQTPRKMGPGGYGLLVGGGGTFLIVAGSVMGQMLVVGTGGAMLAGVIGYFAYLIVKNGIFPD